MHVRKPRRAIFTFPQCGAVLPQRNEHLQRGASLRSSPPQESTAHMHVYSAGLRRGARFRSEAIDGSTVDVYSAEFLHWCWSSPRSFTAELTSAAKRGVYSAGLRRGARLHSEARSLQWMSTVLGFAAELHCETHLRSEAKKKLERGISLRSCGSELTNKSSREHIPRAHCILCTMTCIMPCPS